MEWCIIVSKQSYILCRYKLNTSRHDWGIHNWGTKCEKVIDRLSFRGCLLGVCSANSVTLSGKSGVSSDKVERPVRGTACHDGYMSSYVYCCSTTDGDIAQLKGVA